MKYPDSRHRPAVAPGGRSPRSGLTLVELLVVLVILIGLAGVISVNYSGGVTVRGADGEARTPEEVATLATMRTVREALVGESGYRRDVGYLRDPDDTEAPDPADLGCLVDRTVAGEPDYNPATKRGWNGPYLLDSAIRYDSGKFNLGSGFGSTNGFAGFADGDLLVLDGWGSSLVLGHENGTDDYWLVSAGKNRNLETNLTARLDAGRGDDLVLFLLTSDPNL